MSVECGAMQEVSDDRPRPLVTFLLVAYNQARYIEEAFRGALSQTYSPLEIIVSDDCSSDETFAIAEQLARAYKGPHIVRLRRNRCNQGLVTHLCAAVREARGDLIVGAAGDDVSYPDRVTKVAAAWIANGRQSGSIFSRFKTIDDRGTIVSNRSAAAMMQFRLVDRPTEILHAVLGGTMGCAPAWTRDIFEVFGDIDPRAIQEDVTIPLRSLLLGSLTFLPDELVLYRLRHGSLSRQLFADHRDRMRKMARWWAGRIANYEQFEIDAFRAVALKRVDADSVAWAMRMVKDKEHIARRTVQFFQAEALSRVGIALGSFHVVPWYVALKWLVIAVAPWSYGLRRSA